MNRWLVLFWSSLPRAAWVADNVPGQFIESCSSANAFSVSRNVVARMQHSRAIDFEHSKDFMVKDTQPIFIEFREKQPEQWKFSRGNAPVSEGQTGGCA